METRSNHILVGAVVLGLVLAIVVFMIWLSQLSDGGRKAYDIFFQQSVEGLNKGSSVTFSGVPIGEVDSINLEPRNPQFVRVRILVREDTPIYQGTTATISGIGFTGVSQIQLDLPEARGQASAQRAQITCPDGDDRAVQCPYGEPVIPTRPGGFAAILNSAPELLERITTLTERLTEVFSDRNQQSITGILANIDQVTRSLAERGPEIAATVAEARVAMTQAGRAMERIGELAGTTDRLINERSADIGGVMSDARQAIRAATAAIERLEGVVGEASPGIQTFSNRTLPEVGQLVRDLRATSESLRGVTERLEQRGIPGLLRGERLPDYNPN